MEQIFWYIYAALLGTSTIGFLIHGGRKPFMVKIDLFVSIVTWIGLFGYVTSNDILTPLVWKLVFFGALFWDIIFSMSLRRQFEDSETPNTLGTVIFTIVLLAPLYYALFHYAF